VNLGIQTNQFYEPPSLLVHNLRAGGRKPGMGCVILRSEFARQFDLFEDDFAFVGEDQIFWAKITLRATIYVLPDCLAQYRQHSDASTAGLVNGGKVDGNSEKFTTWLESYLTEKGVADQDILQALQLWRQECAYRTKYRSLLGLYQRVLPWHLRYRIRDLIVSWRMRK
jgi:hypothetical protein